MNKSYNVQALFIVCELERIKQHYNGVTTYVPNFK